MEKIDLTRNTHFEVPLENEEAIFYASLHFYHQSEMDGPEPNVEKIHCYILDPKRGSMNITLQYDPNYYFYFPGETDPEIDTLILDDLNQAIRHQLENLTR